MRLFRTFCVFWTVLCIVAGYAAGVQVMHLRDATHALDDAGLALTRTGAALKDLSKLPIVGNQVKDAAKSVSAGGEKTAKTTKKARRQIAVVAWLVGLSIAVLPTLPLLVMWRMQEQVWRRLT